MAELLQVQSQLSDPPPLLHLHLDLTCHQQRKYIHHGSGRRFNINDTKPIKSFWSSSPHPQRKYHRVVDHGGALANLATSISANLGHSSVSVGLFNIRSLNNKGPLIYDLLQDKKCISCASLKPGSDRMITHSSIRLYHLGLFTPVNLARQVEWEWLQSSTGTAVTAPPSNSFESIVLQINGPVPTILATIYRPPKSNNNTFFTDFSSFLTSVCSMSPNVIILGDFNIHIDNTINTLTRYFSSVLDSFGLQQHIDFPTHNKGHILDLICCSGLTPLNCTASDLPIYDHKLISFNVNLPPSKTNPPHSISF